MAARVIWSARRSTWANQLDRCSLGLREEHALARPSDRMHESADTDGEVNCVSEIVAH
jgi:hypothetical protein